MNELELLFLVLAVVYFWECICWLRRGTVAFLNRWGRPWQAAHPAALMGNQTGGVILANPLPPLGCLLTSAQLPWSLSPEGVFSYVAQCINPGWRPPQPGKYFRFDAVQKIEASGKQVRVNGELVLKTGSPLLARHLAEQLRQLAKLPADRRGAAIMEILRESLNTQKAGQRLQEFRGRVTWLQRLTNFLFAYLFLIAPLCLWHFGLKRCWIELLVALLMLTGTTALLFARAHKALYPDATEERFTHWFMILLSPATAIRAQDALSRPLLETFHPLAVAQTTLEPVQFRQFARRVLLELRHPCLPLCPTEEPGPQTTERHARVNLLEAVEKFLKQQAVDLAELVHPPTPVDETCRAFCPRCETQFTSNKSTCADCGGLALITFQDDQTAPIS